MAKKMTFEESDMQQAAVKAIDLWLVQHYQHLALVLQRKNGSMQVTSPLHANQNAYNGNVRSGARSVREGVKSGVFDLTLPVPRGGYHGLYIEVKTGKGKLSFNQKAWLEHYKLNGYRAEVCRSVDEIFKTIVEYMGGKK